MRLVLGLAAWVLAAGCGGGADARERTRVFAAASLTEAFTELGAEFERVYGEPVELHFAGTPTLVFQLSEGAPAHVFASADAPNMERVVATGRVTTEPRVFATNDLAIVVPPRNPDAIEGLADLARPDLRVGLCGPDVPAGRYAREALARAGVSVASVSDEPSVKAVVAKVALGEFDAGVVFATDARSASREVASVVLDTGDPVRAAYSIVALDGAGPGARTFVDFVSSPAGRSVLARHGFAGP